MSDSDASEPQEPNTPSATPQPGATTPPPSSNQAEEASPPARLGEPRKKGYGLAIASLVLGIIGVIFALTPGAALGILLGILSMIFGIISLVRKPAKRGVPIAGTVLGALALILGIIFAAVYGTGKPSSSATDAPTGTTAGASAPAASPEPSKTQTPPDPNAAYDKTYGTFAPVNQTGTGDTVIAIPAGAKAGIVIASHNGSSNFSIDVLDASNQSTGDLLVNTIGNYSGTTAFGLHTVNGSGVNVKVTADGAWNITIKPVSSAPDFPLPGGATGDQVYKYGGNAANMAFTNNGQGNFVVTQYNGSIPNLAINEIGPYNGKVPMLAGPSVITVTSDGAWSVAAG